MVPAGRLGALDKPLPKLYDISRLKLENFHQVLHYITANVRGTEPVFRQANTDLAKIVRSRDLSQNSFGLEQDSAEEAAGVEMVKIENQSAENAAFEMQLDERSDFEGEEED